MAKIENFQFCTEYFSTTLWVKNCVKIALSLTVSETLRFFHFSQKIKMAAKSGENWNFFKFCIEYFSTTLWVKNSVEIALSLTVSEILANYSKVVLKIHNEVPKWLLLMYWQSYQSQMQYQASYGHNNLVFKIVVKYHNDFGLNARKSMGTENSCT